MSQARLRTATITANYNNGKYFEECLNGILSQTYKVDDIIIVDDGSTDDSVELITEVLFSKKPTFTSDKVNGPDSSIFECVIKNTRVAFFKQEKNRGPAAARNIAVQEALRLGAEVLCIADSDDILYPPKIEKSVEVMRKYPVIALVYSDYDIYTEATGEVKREFKEPFNFSRLFDECIVSNNSVIAASVFREIGLYDETLFGPEDYDLWLRISERAGVYHIPESLYKYRISGNNITITTPSQKFAEHVRQVKLKALERRNGKQG